MEKEICTTALKAAETYLLYNKKPQVMAGIVICDQEDFHGWKVSPGLLSNDKSCFVRFLYNGIQRGLMGTVKVRTTTTAQEIIDAAVSACFQDPSAEPLKKEELSELKAEVYLLSKPEPVPAEKLSEKLSQQEKYTILAEKNCRQGLCLPLPELNAGEQVETALKNGGIEESESPEFYVFRTDIFTSS